MSDIADEAQDHMERESEGYLFRARKPAGPVANGLCHWCGDDVGELRRWCRDTDCRDLYDKAAAAQRRNGVGV